MKKIIFLITPVTLMVFTGCTVGHEDEHDHSVEIEGKDMKFLTVQEVADLWEIDSEVFLLSITDEVDLEGNYTVNSILEDMREDYPFSPALIKDMAEEIKQQGMLNESN